MKRVPKKLLYYNDGHHYLEGEPEPFTGVGYFENDDGQVTAEIEYRDGLEWGKKREWSNPGESDQLSLEDTMWLGVMHGKSREWFLDGKLAEENDYEIGILVRKRVWDENGVLIEHYEMQKEDPEYAELQDYRNIYKDAPPIEEPLPF
jgi:antitoxin component YwqK of YwqJK toxin-antitoxin module